MYEFLTHLANLGAHWLDGKKFGDDDQIAFGMKSLWLNRTGLIMQLCGAVSVVTDIVGPTKIKDRADKIVKATEPLLDFRKIDLIVLFSLITILISSIYLLKLRFFTENPWIHIIVMVIVIIDSLILSIFGIIISIVGYLNLIAILLSSATFGILYKTISYIIIVLGSLFVVFTS